MCLFSNEGLMYNVFLNNDPTLRSTNFAKSIEEQMNNLRQLEAQFQQYQQSQPQSSAPIWTEIDSIVDSLTDDEKQLLADNDEFIESNNAVLAVIQQEYMRIMKPIVESSAQGHEALQNHLSIVKRLAKKAKEQSAAELKEFREYKLRKTKSK